MTVHTLPDSAMPPAEPAEPPVPVQGWGHEIDGAPPVIINPDASPAALLAWARGQLQQVDAVMLAMGCTFDDETTLPEAVAGLRHFSQQAQQVLAALNKKMRFGE